MTWAAILSRKCRTGMRQPGSVITLIPIAWTMIGLASAAIAILPFRRIAPVLGENLGATSLAPIVSPAVLSRATRIGCAINIAAKYAPFRSNCLPQAMVAAILCRLAGVPYAAHFGVTLAQPEPHPELLAHVWVQCGSIAVTGGAASFRAYSVVACFVPADLTAQAV